MFRLEEWDGFRGTCWTSRRSYESKLTAREARVMDEKDFFRGFAENRNVTEGTWETRTHRIQCGTFQSISINKQ